MPKIYSGPQPRRVMHMGGELQTDMSAPLKNSPFTMTSAEKNMKPPVTMGNKLNMRYGGRASKRNRQIY